MSLSSLNERSTILLWHDMPCLLPAVHSFPLPFRYCWRQKLISTTKQTNNCVRFCYRSRCADDDGPLFYMQPIWFDPSLLQSFSLCSAFAHFVSEGYRSFSMLVFLVVGFVWRLCINLQYEIRYNRAHQWAATFRIRRAVRCLERAIDIDAQLHGRCWCLRCSFKWMLLFIFRVSHRLVFNP